MQGKFPETANFSLTEARGIVKDLFQPNPVYIWADFLLAMFIGTFCFTALHRGYLFDYVQWKTGIQHPLFRWGMMVPCYCVAVLAYYRAVLFTHEIVHLRHDRFRAFRIAWNLMCGIPFLTPTFLYETHLFHHRRRSYATEDDGEYLPWANGSVWGIVGYVAQVLILPVVGVLRFLVCAPLSWLLPGVARWVHRHYSSMVIDPTFVRPLPTTRQVWYWRLQEFGCFAFTITIASLLITGVLPPRWLLQAYLISVGILALNSLRTLGAHRYRHQGEEVSFVEQLTDSVNYPERPWIGELWAPVGLRFHALHHLFPSLPYHNLSTAHERLMRQLPADSPYRQTNSSGLWATIFDLWGAARTARLAAPDERDAAPRRMRGAKRASRDQYQAS